MSDEEHRAILREEFERVAPVFARRTQGRFGHLDVIGFSRVAPGATVLEVGAGTGNFLAVFAPVAGRLIAADLTPGMLRIAREQTAQMLLVAGDGARLPLRSGSVDLATSAHAIHHIPDPDPVLREMARVTAEGGRVMVVDISAPEDADEADRMNEVMLLRDPSHARAFTPEGMRGLMENAGLRILAHRIVERTGRVSNWMWPGEYPEERIRLVHAYVQRHWRGLGMGIQPDGDDFTYVDKRTMVLAEAGGAQTG
jgi:ubiquinone/menaquinone biosynthesis C-methylase UbiE